MRPQYSISAQPNSEPIALNQASEHLRVDSTEDQTYIRDLISVAREYFDALTGRSSATTSYVLTAETWEDLFCQTGRINNTSAYVIPLYRTPLLTVESIKYYAPDASSLTTINAGDYRVITGAEPGMIQFKDSPPSVDDRIDAIQIAFTAGSDCAPAMCKHAIRMLVAHFYENRTPIAFASSSEIPFTLKSLIENQKIGGFF